MKFKINRKSFRGATRARK